MKGNAGEHTLRAAGCASAAVSPRASKGRPHSASHPRRWVGGRRAGPSRQAGPPPVDGADVNVFAMPPIRGVAAPLSRRAMPLHALGGLGLTWSHPRRPTRLMSSGVCWATRPDPARAWRRKASRWPSHSETAKSGWSWSGAAKQRSCPRSMCTRTGTGYTGSTIYIHVHLRELISNKPNR